MEELTVHAFEKLAFTYGIDQRECETQLSMITFTIHSFDYDNEIKMYYKICEYNRLHSLSKFEYSKFIQLFLDGRLIFHRSPFQVTELTKPRN